MEKIAASLLATAGIACAQTYNYDSSSETLVITGKGNTVADRITLEGPITPGSTVPGTSEIFGDTKEIMGTIYLTSQKYLQYALCLLNCLHERRLEPL